MRAASTTPMASPASLVFDILASLALDAARLRGLSRAHPDATPIRYISAQSIAKGIWRDMFSHNTGGFQRLHLARAERIGWPGTRPAINCAVRSGRLDARALVGVGPKIHARRPGPG